MTSSLSSFKFFFFTIGIGVLLFFIIFFSSANIQNNRNSDHIRHEERRKDAENSLENRNSSTPGPQSITRRNDLSSLIWKPTSSIDYITPRKVTSHDLHQDDLLYSDDMQHELGENDSGIHNKTVHNTGHFRHNKADVWDPHPQYQFTAFGKTFHLLLRHDSKFTAPNMKVTHIFGNHSTRHVPVVKPDGCYYSGTLKDEPRSIVVVSLCSGMMGHINTVDGSYFIEPVIDWKNLENNRRHPLDTFLHTITYVSPMSSSQHPDYYESSQKEDVSVDDVFVDDFVEDSENSVGSDDLNLKDYGGNETRKRTKRSTPSSEYVVELMVVADRKMADYHGAGLHNYILTLMSIVAKIYKDKSIGNPMHIAVVKLVVLSDMDIIRYKHPDRGVSASELLDDFCHWQKQMNDANDASYNHHDCALLLTREHVCRSPTKFACNNTLGLAQLGTMCQKNSCAIVRDSGLSAAFTIAHELGHVLSMPHDDEAKCNLFREKGAKQRVMSRVLDQNTHPWTWSSCSRHFLTEYLDAGYGECLRDSPFTDILEQIEDGDLPGESYTANQQCELLYGRGSSICPHMAKCQSLWCTKEYTDYDRCRTHHMPWAEGTSCDIDHWCQQGQCVPKDRNALLPVDGGWGTWQPYGECSRTCGGGIRKAYRECDNPAPSNGGKYCIGKHVRYQSCGTRECSPGTSDFRTEQCAKYNNNTFNIHNLTSDVQWVPKYGNAEEDRCKLFCRVAHSSAYYQLQDKVIDGTPCGPDTYDICVNGICQKAGCDHILDSNSKLDMCGVCGGNNTTCKNVYDKHNTSHYGYNRVVTIPAGSLNIDVRQRGYQNSNKDGNYLALLDPETGEYILNGNFVVSMFRKILRYGGAKIEYSGASAIAERINSTRPLTKDLIVELLSVGNLNPPDITYQYTVPRTPIDYYKWELTDEFTQCDKVCYGEQQRIMHCLRKSDNTVMPSEACSQLPKLDIETRQCNVHCTLRWKAISQSECSSACGPGTRTVTYQCIQEFHYMYITPAKLPDAACSHITIPSESQPCMGRCDEARWQYYDWQPCSVTCGSGIQTRFAKCVDDLGRTVDEYKCTASEKITEKACNLERCPEWAPGTWSSCSVTCGIGGRRRQILCSQENKVVSSDMCNVSKKPAEREICQMPECPTWITGEWSKCSVSCGVGVVTRSVRCSVQEESACSAASKPAETETCMLPSCPHENEIPDSSYNFPNQEPLFVWKTGEWGPCTKTCGRSSKMRPVRCYNSITKKPVDRRNCLSSPVPQVVEICNGPPCTTWKTTDWSPCSTTCGRGTSRRKVKCVSLATLEEVPRAECSGKPPEIEVSCESHPCPASPSNVPTTAVTAVSSSRHFTYNWRTGVWGECSASCGGGMKVRAVVCQNEFGAPSNECLDPKPESSVPCNTERCPSKYLWKYGDWSKCNQTCGKGYQRRQTQCETEFGETVSESHCMLQEKPLLVQQCEETPCPVDRYEWRVSAWNPCAATCGPISQTRTVECVKIGAYDSEEKTVVDARYCTQEQPESRKECDLPNCQGEDDPYFWVPGSWSECSQLCGKKGKQKRRLYCYNRNGRRVNRQHCKMHPKPSRKRKCNRRKCGFMSCMEIKMKLQTDIDREYLLSVENRNISVYCHNMSSSAPLEFLTLPMGESENYSEFYDRRLVNPDSCPNSGERRLDCPCVNERIRDAGITMFRKVRLNITSLEIITNDYTYAIKNGSKFIPYGEAGDCYSRARCPQGRFSIDITGTGLRISSAIKWVEYKRGTNTTMWINKMKDNRKVVGKCGGFCGRCKPDIGLKLDVLPP